MNLDDFLEARIAEDEAAAMRTGVGNHSMHASDAYGTYNAGCPDCRGLGTMKRALAECKAKREIIRHLATYQDAIVAWQGFPVNDPDPESEWRQMPFRAMAAVYADHPDYREEWRHA